jgi:hypothetical protein
MPNKPEIEIWIDILEDSQIERPFTARRAYDVIVNTPAKNGRRRRMVPRGTYQLSRKLALSSRIKVVGTTRNESILSNGGGEIAQYDFV